ncbi:hypothetical protein TNCV_1885521 [Trichonephila clavipes]|nr:hypothetical protein TNCV_1885521 [Trichonephila clavipes]
MLSKLRGMSPKKGKDLRRPLEHLKMWKEYVSQFRPVCDNDYTILTRSPRKSLHKVWFQQDKATAHTSRVFMGVL